MQGGSSSSSEHKRKREDGTGSPQQGASSELKRSRPTPPAAATAATIPKVNIDTGLEFDVVLIDPPWEYSNKGVKAAVPYSTLSAADLQAMQIPHRTNGDPTMLFMWATPPMLMVAGELIKSWGFKYKTAWVWGKTDKGGCLTFGPGFWGRACHEELLLAERGTGMFSRVTNHSTPGGALLPRAEHSRKPDHFRAKIRALFGDNAGKMRFLEVFARPGGDARGWHRWGNEIHTYPKVLAPAVRKSRIEKRKEAALQKEEAKGFLE